MIQALRAEEYLGNPLVDIGESHEVPLGTSSRNKVTQCLWGYTCLGVVRVNSKAIEETGVLSSERILGRVVEGLNKGCDGRCRHC